MWDDHEVRTITQGSSIGPHTRLKPAQVADNTWRAGSSELNNTEDSFVKDGGVSVDQRKMNAVRAYFEWSECSCQARRMPHQSL